MGQLRGIPDAGGVGPWGRTPHDRVALTLRRGRLSCYRERSTMQNPPQTDARVVILGGGLTGISTAFHLRRPWLLVEKEARLGGHARTDETRGFHFDKTGHWLHLRDPYMKQLVAELLPGAAGSRRAQGAHLFARRAHALSVPGQPARPAAGGRERVPHRFRARAQRSERRRSRRRTSRTSASRSSAPASRATS